MHIEQLKYIVEVAKTNSMSSASENLFLTQPALSQSIKNLELELGIQIFTRSRQGVLPTQMGRTLIHKANEVLVKLEELHKEVEVFKTSKQEKIKISSSPDLMSSALKSIIEFKLLHPELQIEIYCKPGPEVLLDIHQGKVDFGLLNLKNLEGNSTKLEYEQIAEGKVKALINKHSKFAIFEQLTVQDIENEQFVQYSGPIYKQLFHNTFTNSVHTLLTSSDVQLLKTTVALGQAIYIVPDIQIKNDSHLGSDIIPIDFLAPNLELLKVGWITAKKLSQSSRLFLEQLYKTISSINKTKILV